MSVYVDDAPRPDPAIFELGVPVLGICYGAQLMALELGGTVTRTGTSEFGKTALRVAERGVVLAGLDDTEQCWMSHRDCVTGAPDGFVTLATSDGAPVAAMEDAARGLFAVQFHPEVVHTPRGMDVLRNFLYEACGCGPTWTPASIIEEQVGAHPRPGRADRQGGARAVGRRRFHRGRGARPPGHRRPAHLRVHRPGHDALERGRARGRDVHRAPQDPADRGRRAASGSSTSWSGSPTRSASARSSARSSSAASKRSRASSPTRGSSCRAPSTAT